MSNLGPSLPTHNPNLVLPYISLVEEGNLIHLRPKVTPSEPQNNQRYTQNNSDFLCPPNCQICGWDKKLGA